MKSACLVCCMTLPDSAAAGHHLAQSIELARSFQALSRPTNSLKQNHVTTSAEQVSAVQNQEPGQFFLVMPHVLVALLSYSKRSATELVQTVLWLQSPSTQVCCCLNHASPPNLYACIISARQLAQHWPAREAQMHLIAYIDITQTHSQRPTQGSATACTLVRCNSTVTLQTSQLRS